MKNDGKALQSPEPEISDETAYRNYLQGEESAAQILVERYGDALTFYLQGYLKNLHDAEDLMIEAFSLLFAKERPIREKGSFRAYLYKTARHLAIRHSTKHRLFFLQLEELSFEPSAAEMADTGLLRKERDRKLYEGLLQLKTEYREVLYLIYFENMSYREAGQALGKTETQITNLVYRGRQSLKKILEQEGYEYEDK